MAKDRFVGSSLLRATLVSVAMLAPYAPPAYARIGVTSATDGDPLGKPPQENERVLRIGIDVQANELVTTKANDRAHLVFLDGTSITVGPNAQLTLDKFVYDPDTKKGELAINVTKGVFRVVGGKISKTNAITVTTPSSTMGIRGGIAIFNVSNTQTVSTFVFGSSLTVNGGGATQTITRAGSQVVTNFGGTPGNPTPVPRGGLTGNLNTLEGGAGGTGGNADQQSQNSGFSGQNSGKGPQTYTPPPTTSTTTSNTTTQVVSNTNPAGNPGDIPTVTTVTTEDKTVTTTNKTKIVTFGRYLQDKPYLPGTFNPSTLSADRNPDNNQALNSPSEASNNTTTTTRTTTTTQTKDGAVVSQTSTTETIGSSTTPTLATISTGSGTSSAGGSSGGSLQVPWMPGQIFQFNVDTELGPANGLGLVAANQGFFAYTFVVASGANAGKKFLMFGGDQTPKANFPTQGVGAQTPTNLSSPGNLPFAPDSVGGDAGLKAAANVSPLYSVYTPNLNGRGTAVPDALQVTIAFSGNTTTQKSYMGVFISNYGTDRATNTVYGAGTFMDSYRMGANQKIGRGISYQATADTGSGNAIYGESGQYQVYVPDKVTTTRGGGGHHHHSTTTRVPGAALDQAAANQPPTSYYPVTMATPVADTSTLPADLGQNRTTQTMGGYVGGLVESHNGTTFTTRIPLPASGPGNVSISTDAATNQAMGTIVLRGLDGSLLAPSTTTLQLGGKSGANGPASAFIDDSRYAMITQTNDADRKSTVQKLFQTYNITDNTMLASYKTAPAALPGGVQPCTCEYLSWGFWSSNISYSGGYRNDQTDNINLGSYVVGQLTTALQMPQTGTATYNGFMIGNVQNGNNAYIGTGNFTMPWSYAHRAGTFSATFDGTSYGGVVAATNSGGTNFAGAFGSANLRFGALVGSFFGPQAQNIGGAFAIGTNASSYKASGIFAGQR